MLLVLSIIQKLFQNKRLDKKELPINKLDRQLFNLLVDKGIGIYSVNFQAGFQTTSHKCQSGS